MNANMLRGIINRALRAAGFKGFRASVYYCDGLARVCLNNGYEGIYSVHKGCFISWH